VLVTLALILAGTLFGSVYFLLGHWGGGIPVGGGPTGKDKSAGRHVSDKFNYRYDFPPGWTIDADLKNAVGSNLWAIHRTEPDAWMTLLAREYAIPPRDGQIFDEFYRRMGTYFTDLECEQHPDGQLAGQRAMRFVFQGKVRDVGPVVGEAYLLVYQGVGYAMLTWSATDAVARAAPEYEDLRLRFGLLDRRASSVETRPPSDFQGSKQAYTLRDDQAIWKKNDDYLELYQADLALEAIDPTIADARTNTAIMLVTLHNKESDLKIAATMARTALAQEQKKDYPETKIEVIAGPSGPLDRFASVGNQPGHVAKLHVINGENRQRFVVLATVLAPDGTWVLHGECPWERRRLWERDFDRLIASFRLKQ
jgi:hypothetical protein